MKKVRLLAPVLVLAMVLAACQTGTDEGGEDAGATKTVKIGFISPLTGPLAALGLGMRNSVQLAIDQANKEGKIKGWKIELAAEDDAADAKQGAAAAQKLASDPEMGAVIGTLNSSVAQACQPILDQAGIAMVSPANTNPTLTLGLDWQKAPKRQFATYFRVVATDREQGQFAAKYAYDTLKKRNAVMMHDKKTYGQGLQAIFADTFTKAGGKVLDTIEINPGEGDYKTAITRAKAKNPDIIYIGGEYPEAGVLAKNMSELGLKPPDVVLMGGDGIVEKKFVEIAGKDPAQGHYATLVGASAEFLPESKDFQDDYKKAGFKDDYSSFGPQSYDSANIVIEALADVLEGKSKIDSSVRKAIVSAIGKISYSGALGKTSFDEYGDTKNRLLSVLKVEGDNFKGIEAKSI